MAVFHISDHIIIQSVCEAVIPRLSDKKLLALLDDPSQKNLVATVRGFLDEKIASDAAARERVRKELDLFIRFSDALHRREQEQTKDGHLEEE